MTGLEVDRLRAALEWLRDNQLAWSLERDETMRVICQALDPESQS